MLVKIQMITMGSKSQTLNLTLEKRLMEIVHHKIAHVIYHNDWVQLIPMDSREQQKKRISYRKDLVFSVVEEKED